MRKLMNIVEMAETDPERILTEMPELIDATDFAMMDPIQNLILAEKLMKSINEIIRETPDYILFRTGEDRGNIAMVMKRSKKIVYWVRFVSMKFKEIGPSVTQVALWRNLREKATDGVTNEIFFDYPLRDWGTIMSDAMQTRDGQKFWINMMGRAVTRGHKVGLFNMFSKGCFRVKCWWNDK